MLIIGGLEDQTTTLVWQQISSNLFSIDKPSLADFHIYKEMFPHFLEPWTTNQPILWTIVSSTLSLFGSNFYNLLVLFSLLLSFVLSVKLFRNFKMPVIYALIFTFSAYTWSHLGRHLEMSQIWIYPAVMLLTQNISNKGFKSSFKLGLLLAIAIGISNYLAFFSLIFVGLFICIKALQDRDINYIKYGVFTFVVTSFFTLLILTPFISKQILHTNNQNYTVAISRPYEDFFTFSTRPWYYVIPPVNNPWLGEYSKQLLSKIEATGNYLADDYFPGEHQGNYFGLMLILSTSIIVVYALKQSSLYRYKIKGIEIVGTFKSKEVEYSNQNNTFDSLEDNNNAEDKRIVEAIKVRKEIILYTVLIFLLLLCTLPPYIELSGLRIYTPGELLARFFPMFRATTRASILVLLILLYLFATGIKYISENTHNKYFIKFLKPFLYLLLVVTVLETYIPVKTNIEYKPAPYMTYLKDNPNDKLRFVVYPYSLSNEAFYWLPYHKKLLLNPRNYNSGSFSSEEFTKVLDTYEGMNTLILLKPDYFIVSKNSDMESMKYFLMNENLELETELEDSYIFTIKKY